MPQFAGRDFLRRSWWLAIGADGFYHLHGWGRGHESVCDYIVIADTPTVTTRLRFKELDQFFLSSCMSYTRDLSGVNLEVRLEVVPEGDPALENATVFQASGKTALSGNRDTIVNKPALSECAEDLGSFQVGAFFQ